MRRARHHIVVAGDHRERTAIDHALTKHYPEYEKDRQCRTRLTVVFDNVGQVHDFIFGYKELMDNCHWRVVDLTGPRPTVEPHRPQYEGRRKDFVDVEWEFVIGTLSNPILQEKIRRWANDATQRLTITLCHEDAGKNKSYADRLKRRLPGTVRIETRRYDPESEKKRMEELLAMAKYLHYFYQASYELRHVPTELPEDEVDKAWGAIDDKMKMSNICNVMSIPHKMELLGHDRDDWGTFYALTSDEIELLTAVEHNRWSVERLIQGTRPCTDEERREVEDDMRLRLQDEKYAEAHPVSLKKRYKSERNAHYDLCAFSELGVDETGLPVTRYDRDLTAAIPLIVKTYHDRQTAKKEN